MVVKYPTLILGVVFGSDDYCASIGATRTTDGKELLYARQKIVLTAKAFQLQAIDMVHIDYKDHEGIEGMLSTSRQFSHRSIRSEAYCSYLLLMQKQDLISELI